MFLISLQKESLFFPCVLYWYFGVLFKSLTPFIDFLHSAFDIYSDNLFMNFSSALLDKFWGFRCMWLMWRNICQIERNSRQFSHAELSISVIR